MARIHLYGGRLSLVNDPANTTPDYVASVVKQHFSIPFEHKAKHEVHIAHEPILTDGVGGRLGHIKEVEQDSYEDGRFHLSS